MAYQNNNVDWIGKEKRELFCKSVNTLLMRGEEEFKKEVLDVAKEIVDTAFKNYPDNTGGTGDNIENIIK